ncbi:BID domain-containing T4SS effector [Candidatus Bartonella washoeensis]|uniref:Bartonella effector protein BID domain-containing protein n=1 Tax=Cardidatus Bartonella washoeensis 085-0475 TaxID=1094564 RepID=J0QUJ6_9HYPH|nr:BID domain-containing T4SS effector [Bartonella washoeensis]EJF86804.1 hypothetical protein MCW_00027 [Bartonella washoeensis 085-0475]
MKKKAPPPSAPLSVKELRKRYEKLATDTSPSQFLRVRPAPQRPPRMRDIEREKQSLPEGEVLHATFAPQRPPRMRDKEREKQSFPEGKVLHAAFAPPKPPRMKKQIAKIMQQNLLVEAHKAEIQHWCGIVYGNPNILQKRIAEIQKQPAMGEHFSREITLNPRSVYKLAGHQMLGFKTNARKNAEDSFSSLCATIKGYVEAVKQVQESMLSFPYAQPSPHGQTAERVPLSNKEIASKIQKDPSVQYSQAEIQHWCQIVYGNPLILQERTEELQKNPTMSEELSWQVANHPMFFSKLAGHQILGIKNSTRKEAEAGISSLCNAIEGYADTIKRVKESVINKHQEKQKHQRQSSELTQDLTRQQCLLKPEQTVTAQNQGIQASMPEQQQPKNVQPSKVYIEKAMAFVS